MNPRALVYIVVIGIGSLPVAARAQADDAAHRAAARALFHEGVGHADAERWADAADSFGRAYGAYASGAIALNWGIALAHDAQLVAATEAFRRALRRHDTTGAQRAQAQAQLALIEPRLAYLRIEAQGADAVRLDGAPLPDALVGVDVPVDPGVHTIVASRGAHEGSPLTVTVGEGEHAGAVAPAPAAAPVRAPAPDEVALRATMEARPAPLATPSSTPGEPALEEQAWFWALIGGGAAVVIAAVVISVALTSGEPSGPRCEDLTLGCVEAR